MVVTGDGGLSKVAILVRRAGGKLPQQLSILKVQGIPIILEAAEIDPLANPQDVRGYAGCLIFPARFARAPFKSIDVPDAVRRPVIVGADQNQISGN